MMTVPDPLDPLMGSRGRRRMKRTGGGVVGARGRPYHLHDVYRV